MSDEGCIAVIGKQRKKDPVISERIHIQQVNSSGNGCTYLNESVNQCTTPPPQKKKGCYFCLSSARSLTSTLEWALAVFLVWLH